MTRQSKPSADGESAFGAFTGDGASKKDQQIQELQDQLTAEKDRRQEERFVGLVILVILLDVVFFSVMSTFGGPLALLVLELIILIPLARRMGMEEIARILSAIIHRLAGRASGD